MRGIRLITYLRISIAGITPAHAGNTVLLLVRNCNEQDHPRACGEYFILPGAAAGWEGSPPRMRGILVLSNGGMA